MGGDFAAHRLIGAGKPVPPASACGGVARVPYFIYKLRPPRPPEKAGSFAAYRAARTAVREMRRALDRDDPTTVRMVFAAGEAQAERLLTERREPRPLGEDA